MALDAVVTVADAVVTVLEIIPLSLFVNVDVLTLTADDPAALSKRVHELRFGVELWQAFLWAALVLALLELIVAREPRAASAA